MKGAAIASPLQLGASALVKSLSDPKVLKIAESLNLNLRDPATLNRLIAETGRVLSSTEVSLGAEQAQPALPVPGQSAYVRKALRMYREIAALK